MKIIFCFAVFLFSSFTFAQNVPTGLTEGLMANTGAATQDSTASSIYNPSLLLQRKERSFSIGGNTLGTINSEDEGSTMSSSLQFAPTYISSILTGTSVVHEFFLATVIQGNFNFATQVEDKSFVGKMNINAVKTGYSLAFYDLPMAFQVLFRYSQADQTGISAKELAGAPNAHQVSYLDAQSTALSVGLGLSTHLRFGGYTLGINFNSRGYRLIDKGETKIRNYVSNATGAGSYEVSDHSFRLDTAVTESENTLLIGHSFSLDSHEFLTDTDLNESSENVNLYTVTQSFGYRYGKKGQDQFLCGISNVLNTELNKLGQSFSISTGYAWYTRALRSNIGAFYSKNTEGTDTTFYGLIFGSEFGY